VRLYSNFEAPGRNLSNRRRRFLLSATNCGGALRESLGGREAVRGGRRILNTQDRSKYPFSTPRRRRARHPIPHLSAFFPKANCSRTVSRKFCFCKSEYPQLPISGKKRGRNKADCEYGGHLTGNSAVNMVTVP